jgi:hypothetical protein
MEDIVTRLRAEIAWEPDLGELLAGAADHIESLRREVRTQRLEIAGLREERRALLEADRPAWFKKPYYVDPPEGWRYGFPKVYDPAKDGDMVEWMISQGYPKKLAKQGLPCTFTACE